jgi:hypothetical protein
MPREEECRALMANAWCWRDSVLERLQTVSSIAVMRGIVSSARLSNLVDQLRLLPLLRRGSQSGRHRYSRK